MTEIKESESKHIDEKIQTICVNYLDFLSKCAKDRDLRDKFMSQPRPYLCNMGMNIPDKSNVKVVLDNSTIRWPVVYIRKKDDTEYFVIKEGRLSMSVEEFEASGDVTGERVTTKHQAELEEEFKGSIKNFDVLIRFPFFDAWGDDLGEITFDDSTIILTSC